MCVPTRSVGTSALAGGKAGQATEMEVLSGIPFDVDPEALLGSLRIEPGGERAAAIVAAVEAVRPVVRPKAVYDVCYIEGRGDDTVELSSGVTFTSRVLRVNLDGTQRVFPFIATCGTEVAERAAECEDLLVKYALDSLMEQALRAASRHAVETIKRTQTLRSADGDDVRAELLVRVR